MTIFDPYKAQELEEKMPSDSDLRLSIFKQIDEERARQDQKWGEQNHPPGIWCAILTEEVGELAKEMLDLQFGFDGKIGDLVGRCRSELIQVAAVAVSMLEYLDRNHSS